MAEALVGDDKHGDESDTVLDEDVHEPELELGPVLELAADAVSEVVSASPSVSVVPTPTLAELSPAVPA